MPPVNHQHITRGMNRARQDAITTEIMEIVRRAPEALARAAAQVCHIRRTLLADDDRSPDSRSWLTGLRTYDSTFEAKSNWVFHDLDADPPGAKGREGRARAFRRDRAAPRRRRVLRSSEPHTRVCPEGASTWPQMHGSRARTGEKVSAITDFDLVAQHDPAGLTAACSGHLPSKPTDGLRRGAVVREPRGHGITMPVR